MTFQPVAPFGGIAGWTFMERTRARQEAAFQKSPGLARDTGAFEDRIGKIRTAADLVNDRALLRVALGAFGLDGDLGNRFFIRKVLEEGTASRTALANRLADKRYLALAEAFGFGDRPGGNVSRPGFAADITARYRDRQFEIAVGQTNPDLRLALGLGREMSDIVARPLSNDGRWFAMMASPPMRTVFERALGLPREIGGLDIDRQLSVFKQRAAARLGTSDFANFATPEGEGRLRRAFLAAADPSAVPNAVRGRGALALLAASNLGSASRFR